jgi:outer membrane lipoprotein-sorting protein
MSSQCRLFLSVLVGLYFPLALMAADTVPPAAKPAAAKLTAAQVVDKHIAARGGLQAWRGVQTVSWSGKMDVGYADSAVRSTRFVRDSARSKNAKKQLLAQQAAEAKIESEKQVQLPFRLEMKRPGKSRVEVEFDGKTAVQVYDGSSGWMLRPYLNRTDWEPFSPEQTKEEATNPGLDGPLIDYATKGTTVELESVEPVEGHDAYKLKLKMKNGDVRHVWIDAQSFLDVRIEGTPRHMDGRMRTVWVYQRDFRAVQGLMVPFVLETAVDGYKDTHKMVIEKVALNPPLDDSKFVPPKS